MSAMAILTIAAIINLVISRPDLATAGNLAFLATCFCLIVGAWYFAERQSLEMNVTRKSIRIKRISWRKAKEKIKLNRIESYEIYQDSRPSGYSGWDVKFGNPTLNLLMSCRYGIQLNLKSGESVLFPTRKPLRIAKILGASGIRQLS